MKRVFIFSSGSIFGEGVRELVGRDAALEIVGSETDLGLAMERIRDLQPDVVLVDEERWASDLAPSLMQLKAGGAGIKVVGVSLRSNTLSCYSRESRTIRQVEDLMNALS